LRAGGAFDVALRLPQAGKFTTIAALALAQATFRAGTQALLVSRSFRQAAELFRTIKDLYFHAVEFLKSRHNGHELVLKGDSRLVCVPCIIAAPRGGLEIGSIDIGQLP
jgi:hypothetical protein